MCLCLFAAIERGLVLPVLNYLLFWFCPGLLACQWRFFVVGQVQPLGSFFPAVDMDAHSVEDGLIEGLRFAVFQVAVIEGRIQRLLHRGRGMFRGGIGRSGMGVLESLFLFAAKGGESVLGAHAVGDFDGVEFNTACRIFILHNGW